MTTKYKTDASFLIYPEAQFKFIIVEDLERNTKTFCMKASNFETVLLEKEIDVSDKNFTTLSLSEMIYQQYGEFMRSPVWEKFYNENFELQEGFRPIFLNGRDGDERFKKFSEASKFPTAKEAVEWAENNLPEDCTILEILNVKGISVMTIEIED